jgi:hypothetical protein
MAVNNYFRTTGFILLLVGLQCVYAAQGQSPAQQEQTTTSSQPQPQVTVINPSPSQTAVEQPKSSVEADKSQKGEDQSTFTDWIQVGINAALLVIIALQTAIYRRQSKIMQTQVDHARIAERAYLGVARIGMSDLVIGQYPAISALVENGGRTPAFKVRAPGKIDLQPAGKRSKTEIIKSTFEADENSILAAGASRTSVYEFTIPCDATMKHHIESGTVVVFVQGTIWYEDAWENEHRHPFFFEWNPSQKAFMDRREREHGEASQQNPD